MRVSGLLPFKIRALALPLSLATSAALGQPMLEEVLVTAQKREQSLQDVPIAVAAMSGEKINDLGLMDLQELTRYVPNVNLNSGQAQPNLFIRGVGSGTNAGFEQSVGLYIDGVYSGRGQLSNVPLTLDLERIEILKGPQGILFGKNTIGGAINISSAGPSPEFESYIEAIYAPDHGEEVYTGVVSGPFSGTVSGRLAVRHDAMDGWFDNVTLNDEGPRKDNTYLRGSILWDINDDIEVLAKYEYGDFSTTTLPQIVYQSDQPVNFLGEEVFPVISDRDHGASDVKSYNDTRTDVFALAVNWDLDFAQLTSISAYSAYDLSRTDNSDFSPTPALNRQSSEDFEQYSQEVRLASPGSETINWIAGLYYESSTLNVSRLNTDLDFALAGPLAIGGALVATEPGIPSIFDQDTESVAAFAQADWNISERVRASIGIRYGKDTKELDKQSFADGLKARAGTSLPLANIQVFSSPATRQSLQDLRSHRFTGLKRTDEKVTYSTNLQWDASEDAMLYASVSTGYKSGGFDEAYSGAGETVRLVNPFTGTPDLGADGQPLTVPGADPSVLEYDPEEVISYELGAKMSLLDGAAELNIALFRMEYEDLQVSSLVGDVFRVSNAGESVSQGLEIDGRIALSERLQLGAAIAYLDATYDSFKGATCTVPQVTDPTNNPGCLRQDGSNVEPPPPFGAGGQDLGGETLLFSPEWSFNWNLAYIVPLGNQLELRNSIDMNYSDAYFSALDLDPNTRHDSLVLWNARIALAPVNDRWSIALIIKNLSDEKSTVWNNDVPLTNSNSYFGLPERPRSVAIQARYRFD